MKMAKFVFHNDKLQLLKGFSQSTADFYDIFIIICASVNVASCL